jgi:tight adherence protein B
MDNLILLIGLIFTATFLLTWVGLYFGSRWFFQRQQRVASSAASDLERMFIFTDARRIKSINLGALVVLPLLAWLATANPAYVVACGVFAFVAPGLVLRQITQRRLGRFETQLPDALLMLSGALRAGASIQLALESVAEEGRPPVSQEFSLLLRELKLGNDFAAALQNLERRVPLQDLTMVTAGMALAREVGANLAETLESIAATLRAKLQMEGKIRSLTAQGKLQGLVMSGLPVFLIAVLKFMEPEAMAPLFDEWYGWCTLTGITVAILVGYHFIRKITNIDV